MKKLMIHRKEQWDLDCKPIVCVHAKDANSSTRVFCLWFWGIQIGNRLHVWRRVAA